MLSLKRKFEAEQEPSEDGDSTQCETSKRNRDETVTCSFGTASDEDVCEKCATFDIPSVLSEPQRHDQSGWTISVIDETSRSRCQSCRFFEASCKSWNFGPGTYDVELELFRLGRNLLYSPASTLRISRVDHKRQISRGWILPYDEGEYKPFVEILGRKLKSNVDYDLVRKWMLTCETCHSKPCGNIVHETIPGFRLINCETRKIVPVSESCRYAALSYVWGKSSSDTRPMDRTNLPNPAPLVVEDTLKVAAQLHIPYVWIDCYCIDQNDTATKHTQIHNMHKIYNGAALTIIDACGDGPDYGLLGVSKMRPKYQMPVSIRGKKIIAVPDVVGDVAKSTWSTRGWTYQEGLLSRRRLIFTKSQVYFQCLSMNCCEAISDPTVYASWLGTDTCRAFRVFPTRAVSELGEMLNEYQTRRLSFDTDTLNAFMGILQTLEVRHFYGLTIRRDSPPSELLFWTHQSAQISRRPEFPSWTWAGWKGLELINFGGSDSSLRYPLLEVMIKPKASGLLNELHTVIELDKAYDLYEPRMYLTGWMSKIQFSDYGEVAYGFRFVAESPGRQGDVHFVAETAEVIAVRERLRHKPCEIMLAECSEEYMHALLVEPSAQDSYTRVGFVKWRGDFRGISAQISEQTEAEHQMLQIFQNPPLSRYGQAYWGPHSWNLELHKRSICLV